ncbi:hypothetical protein GNE08_00295 [Trichormus variabilis ARAD]|uniref:Uncharacterized protein n=1 Tax=Trichormus variabilis N2B TaxID=2681315 RepID=A0ABR6S2F8_ANAVA|nr:MULTISPECIES: hypothetical protein [Nostocaceae]MBC1212658.1 hypothetical protein [Trichormus variabilis ARAD]MBC1255125.1 hypothetical protein [Trichormus variabilis V5]MBC1265759.1 hypothetical protein [Trichormus variabilis FSR]MBC1300570.1 hypothetical protein [Trichormus variabilis N2B]MBC1324803.1 hypothetical protein [Trichormus variabilis 9RC]
MAALFFVRIQKVLLQLDKSVGGYIQISHITEIWRILRYSNSQMSSLSGFSINERCDILFDIHQALNPNI